MFNPSAILIAMVLIGLSGIWLLLINAAHEENREFRNLLQSQVATGTENQIRDIGKAARDYAIWDELDAKINQKTPDMQWLRRNLTPSVYENLDVDVALLIDPASRTILYGIKNGRILINPKSGLELPESAWIWMQMAQNNPAGSSQQTIIKEIEQSDGLKSTHFYMTAIHPITAETPNHTRHGNKKMLLFARQIDRTLLQELSRSYHILEPVISPEAPTDPALMSQPLIGLSGVPLAYLVWRFTPPGEELITLMTPGALSFALLLLILGLMLSHKARQLQASQEDTLKRLEKQGELLRSIALNSEGQGKSLQDLQTLCHQLASTLETDRISIWRHDPDSKHLHCLVGADLMGPSEQQGVEIDADGGYLQEIGQDRYLCIDNLELVHNTNSFTAYARRNGLHSILDATIRVGKEVRAIISAESRRQRHWTQDEINFICSAADGIALLTESNARQTAEGELTSLFYYDHSTGLPNNHRFRLHLDTLTSARNARAGACVLMDLSNLGTVTEAYGQSVGDLLVNSIAARLDNLTHAGEMAARTGEARFALWLEGETESELNKRINHLQQSVQLPLQLDGNAIHPIFQTGASLFPGDGHNADTLLSHARSALRHARQLSRHSWVRFNQAMSQTQSENHRLQMALREALPQGQLSLHYQPIINLDTNRITGTEALLRWQHPQKGMIPPDVFIPLAEEDDALINSIGAWVLDQACAQVARWRRDYSPHLTVAVNVSVRQMETPGFHQLVADTLARHQLPHQAIDLEVTESIALSDISELETNLNALQAQNIRLAIDDFGTGYASFSYLRRFPVSRLKVDRQFFDQVPANPQRSNLVKTIISMGHTLGAEVVGEGVEQADQVAFLKQAGGDYAQGYYFSRPLAAEQMEALLRDSPDRPHAEDTTPASSAHEH